MNEQTDEMLARAVQEGDKEAFGVLVERFEAKMLRYASKFLFDLFSAEDVVQEVFIKAYVNIKSFDAGKRFSPWLYRIAHNEFINALKRKGREPLPFFDPDELFPHPVSTETADRALLEEELKTVTDGHLRSLGPKYREPIVLLYYEGLDYKEIAEVLQIPISTVGVRIKRAKESLKRLYLEHNPEYQSKSI